MTQTNLDESARVAAVTSASSIDTLPLTAAAAKRAYTVASGVLGENGATIDTASFRAFADGSVRFTAHQQAPSMLLGRIGLTHGLMVTSVTVTSDPTQPDSMANGRQWMAEQ